jgi:hypothetical protein
MKLKPRRLFPMSERLHALWKGMAPPLKEEKKQTPTPTEQEQPAPKEEEEEKQTPAVIKPQAILVESGKIPECLVLEKGWLCRSRKNIDRKNLLGTYLLPECTTWLVTWNNFDFPVAILHLAGRYFTLDTRLIESGDFGLFFGKKRVGFNMVTRLYDETWKTYRNAGVVFLDTNECRKEAENRVLIFLPLARSQKLLPYLLRMLLQKIYT